MNNNNLSVKLTINADGNVSGFVKDVNNDLKSVKNQATDTTTKTDAMSASLKKIGHYGALAFAGWGLTAIASDVLAVTKEFDSLKASLVTVTGSTVAADEAFAQIKQFASTTPFQLSEVTDSFIKMEALGLKSSERAMRSYGDTASSMGKSLNQMIEAVADAATGEFERLKEFGIKARSEGENVKFTFRGVTTEVAKNASEIEDYLVNLGEVNFAGGMARQMETVGGQLSNLQDNWDKAFNAIGESSNGVITTSIGVLDKLSNSIYRAFTNTETLRKEAEQLQQQVFGKTAQDEINTYNTHIRTTKTEIDLLNQQINQLKPYAGAAYADGMIKQYEAQLNALKQKLADMTEEVTIVDGIDKVEAEIAAAMKYSETMVAEIAKANTENEKAWNEASKQYHKEYRKELEADAKVQAALNKINKAYASDIEQLRFGMIKYKLTNADVTAAEAMRAAANKGYSRDQINAIGVETKALFELEKANKTALESEKAAAEARNVIYENLFRRLDDGFAQMWYDVADGSKTAFDFIQESFKRMLAEMAHAAITKPIIMSAMGTDSQSSGLNLLSQGLGYGLSMMAGAGSQQASMLAAQTAEFGTAGASMTAEAFGTTSGSLAAGTATVAPYLLGAIAIDQVTGGAISKPLFGGDWKRKNAEISLSGGLDYVSAEQAVTSKKSGGLFSSSKTKTNTTDISDSLGVTVNSLLRDIDTIANQIGYDLANDFSTNVKVSAGKDGDIRGAMADAVGKVTDEAIDSIGGLRPRLEDMRYQGESLTDTLKRLAAETQAEQQAAAKAADEKARIAEQNARIADQERQAREQNARIADQERQAREQIVRDAEKALVSQYMVFESQSSSLKSALLDMIDPQQALAYQREQELKAVDPLLKAQQKRLWALQDEAAAIDKAKAAQSSYQSALSGVLGNLGGAFKTIKQFTAALVLGASATGASYASDLSLAQGGDQNALSSITQSAQAYLDDALAKSTTALDYERVKASVITDLNALPEQVSAQQYIADEIKQAIALQTETLGFDYAASLKDNFDALIPIVGETITKDEFDSIYSGTASDAELKKVFEALAGADGVIDSIELQTKNLSIEYAARLKDNFDALIPIVGETITKDEFDSIYSGTASDAELKKVFEALAGADGVIDSIELQTKNLSIEYAARLKDNFDALIPIVGETITKDEFDSIYSGTASDAELKKVFEALAGADGVIDSIDLTTAAAADTALKTDAVGEKAKSQLSELETITANTAGTISAMGVLTEALGYNSKVQQQSVLQSAVNTAQQRLDTLPITAAEVSDFEAKKAAAEATDAEFLRDMYMDLAWQSHLDYRDYGLYSPQNAQSRASADQAKSLQIAAEAADEQWAQVSGLSSEVARYYDVAEQLAKAKEALNSMPAFAAGGIHTGGLRIVGERGPEIEYTGPSRIINNAQTQSLLDNSELIAEIRALRADINNLTSANNSANSTLIGLLRDIDDRFDDWVVDGLPNFQNTQSVEVIA